MTTHDIAFFGPVLAWFAEEPTTVGDVGLVAIRTKVSFQAPFVATCDIANITMEFLDRNSNLCFGGDFDLTSPGTCEAIGGVFWRLVCSKFAVICSPDFTTSLKSDGSHVLKLFGSEIDVIDALDDAFGEWIVTTKATPFEVFARPGKIGEAVVCGGFVHGPEDEVKSSFDGNNGGAEDWYMC